MGIPQTDLSATLKKNNNNNNKNKNNNNNSNKNSNRGDGLSDKEVASAIETPGFIAPRREVEMIKSYYRNALPLRKGEFQQSKITQIR